jgi:hypothetical protein
LDGNAAPQIAGCERIINSGFVDYIPADVSRLGDSILEIENGAARFERIELVTPNLEALFLELTGRELRD